MHLVHAETGAVLAELTEAQGPVARMRGLLGRATLPEGCGILLRGRQVHTIGMRFAIDAVYLSEDFVVVRVVTLPPGRLGPFERRARRVLEIGAGESQRLGIHEGMPLEIKL